MGVIGAGNLEADYAMGHRRSLKRVKGGTTSHAHFPGLMIPASGSSENSGSCYGFHYGWSGGHRMVAEQLQDGRNKSNLGIQRIVN